MASFNNISNNINNNISNNNNINNNKGDDDDDVIQLICNANAIDDYIKHIGINNVINFIDSTKAYFLLCLRSSTLTEQMKVCIFTLFENNMKDMYETTWGWNKDEKMKELFAPTSKFLLIVDDDDNEKLIAFTMFRFEWDDEDEPEYPVLYCYELQTCNEYQGKGIGKHLMKLLVEIQEAFSMKKVMLTCFKINTGGMNFYLKNGFYIDENSPSKFNDTDCHYEILSNERPKAKRRR